MQDTDVELFTCLDEAVVKRQMGSIFIIYRARLYIDMQHTVY